MCLDRVNNFIYYHLINTYNNTIGFTIIRLKLTSVFNEKKILSYQII